jgi:hypothetical protein
MVDFSVFHTKVPVKQVEIIREFITAPLFFSPEIPVAEPSVSQPMKR